MNVYYIYTDSKSQEIEAKNIKQALKAWGEAPPSVTTPAKFEAWLKKSGGYGVIHENGVQIARVAA